MYRVLVACLIVVAAPALGGAVTAGNTGGGGAASSHGLGEVDCSFPITVEDATGETVTVEEEPEDVVVLGPSAAQHVWDIGAQEKVVGMPVNEFTAYLEGSDDEVDVIGEDGQPIQEQVVGLEPDLVLAPNIVSEDTVESLRAADQTVYYYPLATSMDDIYPEVERTGQLIGAFEEGARVSAEMYGTVDAIERAVANETRPRVYYELGGGWTAGEGTVENDLITRAGGENIATEAGLEGYEPMSQEVVADRDPEWIIVNERMDVPANQAVNESTAMARGQIVEVNPNFLNQHGPRTVVPLQEFARAFHPEAYERAAIADPELPEPSQCAVETADTDEGDEDDGNADGSGPGFGIAVPVLALLVLVAVRVRSS